MRSAEPGDPNVTHITIAGRRPAAGGGVYLVVIEQYHVTLARASTVDREVDRQESVASHPRWYLYPFKYHQ